MKHILRTLLALIILPLAGAAHATIPATERQALLDFYTQTNGVGWSIRTGWNGVQGSECSWFGITCDSAGGHVTGIYLPLNQLSGTLPALSALTNLTDFQVYLNQVTGPIPSLSGLTNLTRFDVGQNQLTGSIPPLAGLNNVSSFVVDSNQLTGPIPSLSGLPNLITFSAHDNQLTGQIPSLSDLSLLGRFDVSFNLLTGAIPSIAGSKNLGRFDVSSNQLTGSIPSLSGLTNLTSFAVASNQLTGPIPSLSGLSNLTTLQVFYNQLTGPMPSFSGLISLTNFNASANRLTGSIPSLSDLSNLTYLSLDSNLLTGSIPSISGLGQLVEFSVSDNQLTGQVPTLSGLSKLTRLDVSSNQLTGPAPLLTDFATSSLAARGSRLCPNALDPASNPPSLNDSRWNLLTGSTPWSYRCVAAVVTYTVTAATAPVGLGSIACASPVTAGATSTCTATPNAGYLTQSIGGCGGTPTGIGVNTYSTAAVNADCTVTATFAAVAPTTYVVTAVATPAGSGSLVCASPVNAGASSTCTASPDVGYVTQGISGCNGTPTASGVNAFNTGAVNADCTVTATFAAVAPATYVVTAVATPAGSGSLVCASPVNAGASSTCTAAPGVGYVTQGISGCGGTPTASGVNTFNTGAVNADCTVTATFAAVAPTTYLVSAVATPAGTGSLVCQSPVNAGATSTCTASPGAGYVTQGISGCGGTPTTKGVATFTTGAVNSDCTVTATFAPAVSTQASVPAPTLDRWALAALGLLLALASAWVTRRRKQ